MIARTKSEDGIVDNDKPTFRAEMQGIMNDTKEIAESAKKEAQSVREDADAGEFDGKTPQKGIDYLTSEEINTFKAETKTYIDEQITERVDKVKSDYIEELIGDYVGGGAND